MESGAVEAHLFGDQNVVFKFFHGGSSDDSVFVVSLIQHQTLVNRFIIQLDGIAVDGNFPHAEIGGDRIRAEGQLQVVKIGMLQIPEFGIGHRNGEGNGFSGGFEGYRADMFSTSGVSFTSVM